VVEGGGIGRRLDRQDDAADGEEADDRLRALDEDDAALLGSPRRARTR
jgi:hypothetical protein